MYLFQNTILLIINDIHILHRKITISEKISRDTQIEELTKVSTSSHVSPVIITDYLYKKVKDPNLVGKFSGHDEGFKAFARYRDIDDEMINEVPICLTDRKIMLNLCTYQLTIGTQIVHTTSLYYA